MESYKSTHYAASGLDHARALQKAHEALEQRLLGPAWGAEDFYSAMAVYRKVAGIEFSSDDDEMLDKWTHGATDAWRQEVKSKGDKINLAEALEKAIAAGIRALSGE